MHNRLRPAGQAERRAPGRSRIAPIVLAVGLLLIAPFTYVLAIASVVIILAVSVSASPLPPLIQFTALRELFTTEGQL
jgi:hypothetical protein